MNFVANFICFPAVQNFWKSVKIWQSYREFKGGKSFLRHSVVSATWTVKHAKRRSVGSAKQSSSQGIYYAEVQYLSHNASSLGSLLPLCLSIDALRAEELRDFRWPLCVHWTLLACKANVFGMLLLERLQQAPFGWLYCKLLCLSPNIVSKLSIPSYTMYSGIKSYSLHSCGIVALHGVSLGRSPLTRSQLI